MFQQNFGGQKGQGPPQQWVNGQQQQQFTPLGQLPGQQQFQQQQQMQQQQFHAQQQMQMQAQPQFVHQPVVPQQHMHQHGHAQATHFHMQQGSPQMMGMQQMKGGPMPPPGLSTTDAMAAATAQMANRIHQTTPQQPAFPSLPPQIPPPPQQQQVPSPEPLAVLGAPARRGRRTSITQAGQASELEFDPNVAHAAHMLNQKGAKGKGGDKGKGPGLKGTGKGRGKGNKNGKNNNFDTNDAPPSISHAHNSSMSSVGSNDPPQELTSRPYRGLPSQQPLGEFLGKGKGATIAIPTTPQLPSANLPSSTNAEASCHTPEVPHASPKASKSTQGSPTSSINHTSLQGSPAHKVDRRQATMSAVEQMKLKIKAQRDSAHKRAQSSHAGTPTPKSSASLEKDCPAATPPANLEDVVFEKVPGTPKDESKSVRKGIRHLKPASTDRFGGIRTPDGMKGGMSQSDEAPGLILPPSVVPQSQQPQFHMSKLSSISTPHVAQQQQQPNVQPTQQQGQQPQVVGKPVQAVVKPQVVGKPVQLQHPPAQVTKIHSSQVQGQPAQPQVTKIHSSQVTNTTKIHSSQVRVAPQVQAPTQAQVQAQMIAQAQRNQAAAQQAQLQQVQVAIAFNNMQQQQEQLLAQQRLKAQQAQAVQNEQILAQQQQAIAINNAAQQAQLLAAQQPLGAEQQQTVLMEGVDADGNTFQVEVVQNADGSLQLPEELAGQDIQIEGQPPIEQEAARPTKELHPDTIATMKRRETRREERRQKKLDREAGVKETEEERAIRKAKRREEKLHKRGRGDKRERTKDLEPLVMHMDVMETEWERPFDTIEIPAIEEERYHRQQSRGSRDDYDRRPRSRSRSRSRHRARSSRQDDYAPHDRSWDRDDLENWEEYPTWRKHKDGDWIKCRRTAQGGTTWYTDQSYIEVPDQLVGLLIGPQGKKIKELESETGIRIQAISKDKCYLVGGYRRVELIGGRNGIWQAKELIEQLLEIKCELLWDEDPNEVKRKSRNYLAKDDDAAESSDGGQVLNYGTIDGPNQNYDASKDASKSKSKSYWNDNASDSGSSVKSRLRTPSPSPERKQGKHLMPKASPTFIAKSPDFEPVEDPQFPTLASLTPSSSDRFAECSTRASTNSANSGQITENARKMASAKSHLRVGTGGKIFASDAADSWWRKSASKVVDKLVKLKEADLFAKPVIEDEIIDAKCRLRYHEVVKHPADLRSCAELISVFPNVELFEKYLNRIWENCTAFNSNEPEILRRCGDMLQKSILSLTAFRKACSRKKINVSLPLDQCDPRVIESYERMLEKQKQQWDSQVPKLQAQMAGFGRRDSLEETPRGRSSGVAAKMKPQTKMFTASDKNANLKNATGSAALTNSLLNRIKKPATSAANPVMQGLHALNEAKTQKLVAQQKRKQEQERKRLEQEEAARVEKQKEERLARQAKARERHRALMRGEAPPAKKGLKRSESTKTDNGEEVKTTIRLSVPGGGKPQRSPSPVDSDFDLGTPPPAESPQPSEPEVFRGAKRGLELSRGRSTASSKLGRFNKNERSQSCSSLGSEYHTVGDSDSDFVPPSERSGAPSEAQSREPSLSVPKNDKEETPSEIAKRPRGRPVKGGPPSAYMRRKVGKEGTGGKVSGGKIYGGKISSGGKPTGGKPPRHPGNVRRSRRLSIDDDFQSVRSDGSADPFANIDSDTVEKPTFGSPTRTNYLDSFFGTQEKQEATQKREARRMARESQQDNPKKRKTANSKDADSDTDPDELDLSILKPEGQFHPKPRASTSEQRKSTKKKEKPKAKPKVHGWRGILCEAVQIRVFDHPFYQTFREEFQRDVVSADPRRRNETLEAIVDDLASDTEVHAFPPCKVERKIMKSFQKRVQAFFKYFKSRYTHGDHHRFAHYLCEEFYKGCEVGYEKAERRAFREANPGVAKRSPEPRDFGAPINSGSSRRRPHESSPRY